MDYITLSIIAPAFVAGVVVLLSHVPLGREVLRRGIIFIDLAIAQVAGLGIILASSWGFEAHGWELQAIALLSALSGALILSCLESISGRYQEALIGSTFVLAACGAILLLANNPLAGEHLKDLLVGQILWVEWRQLLLPALVGVGIFTLWLVGTPWFAGRAFYLLFATAITISVQLVGVYLVFASLILPALAVSGFPARAAMPQALLCGICGYALGLWLSTLLDLPSGAVIVWTLAGMALLTWGMGKRFNARLAQARIQENP